MKWTFFHKLGSPKWFFDISGKFLPWFVVLGVSLLVIGSIWGLAFAPKDYQQGDSFRIIYLHVPTAIIAQSCYMMMAVSAIVSLVWKMKLADVFISSAAPLGALFTFLALFTGAVWGKPTWGTWWVWDARLTSMLILAFTYGAYILWVEIDRPQTFASGAVITIIGWVNIPIIKGSVEWWYTLHQPASIKPLQGIVAIHSSMLTPLLLMFACYCCFTAFIFTIRFKRFIAFQNDYVATTRAYV